MFARFRKEAKFLIFGHSLIKINLYGIVSLFRTSQPPEIETRKSRVQLSEIK